MRNRHGRLWERCGVSAVAKSSSKQSIGLLRTLRSSGSRGADVLAQLGRTVEHPRNAFCEDILRGFEVGSPRERTARLEFRFARLSRDWESLAVPLLVEHWLHEVDDVRFAVASGLWGFRRRSACCRYPLGAYTRPTSLGLKVEARCQPSTSAPPVRCWRACSCATVEAEPGGPTWRKRFGFTRSAKRKRQRQMEWTTSASTCFS